MPLDAHAHPPHSRGYHSGRPPRNKGLRYPADPPRVEEIVAVMREAGDGIHGARIRGLIVVLWRAGLRISEALSLGEGDLDPERGALLVRHGKGGKRGEAGMDDWGWEQLRPWVENRARKSSRLKWCNSSSGDHPACSCATSSRSSSPWSSRTRASDSSER
jgi:integrase